MLTAVAPSTTRVPQLALGAVVVGGLGFGFWLADRGMTEDAYGLLRLFVGWSFIGIGAFAWWRRPSIAIGPLMTVTGYLWFISELSYSGEPGPLMFTLAGVIGGVYHATTVHLLLAFPSGRLTTREAHASIGVARTNGWVTVEVSDNGVGGADLANGSGLRGLADRITALDGRFEINSPPGAGTLIRARIPCE